MNKKKFLIIVSLILLFMSAVTIASDLIIESKSQTYSEKDSLIKFLGDVKVHYDDIVILGDKADVSVTPDNKLDTATFYDQPYAYQIQNNKKREVKANILKLSLLNKILRAEGNTQTIVTEGKTPIAIINSDTQEYDTNTNIMTAIGTVSIKYKDLTTFSDKAVVHTEKGGELDRIDLYGHAKVDETKHHAVADHFIYNAKTDEMTAIGHTMTKTITDSGSEFKITARHQNYDKKNNVFMGNGVVQVWYEDYYGKAPKVTCYPDKQTKKINEIFMIGRSMIRQNEKEIHADKIKMIVDPKSFEAVGNVRTTIKDLGSDSAKGKGNNKDKSGGFL